MSFGKRTVRVHLLPAHITPSTEKSFLELMQEDESLGRPRIVIDCSAATHMSSETILLLLSCLQEAMKHNGDVRLASVSAQGYELLRASGVGPLFETYKTVESAIRSFQHQPVSSCLLPDGEMAYYEEAGQAA